MSIATCFLVLAAAEFFDSDGNRYLTTAELSKAAEALGEAR